MTETVISSATREVVLGRVCPASPEGGKRRTCETCAGCNGNQNGAPNVVPLRRSFAIVAHGSPAVLAGVNNVTT